MKQRLHVEVEPLTEQQWAKIERSLSARLQLEAQGLERVRERPPLRHRSLSTWLAVALAVSVVAVVVLALNGSPLPKGLEHPSRIATGQSASHLAFPGLSVDVEPQSAVVVGAETAQGLLVVLDRGSVLFQVAPRPANAPLIVQAGAVRVRVVGTRFRVVREGEAAAVEVSEGVVEVTFAGQSSRVSAGQRWPAVAAAQQREPSTIASAEPSAQPSLNPQGEPPSAAPALSEVTPSKALTRGRPSAASPAPQETRKSPAAGPSAAGPSAAGPSAAERTASDPPVSTGAPVQTRPHAQAVFEQATALERSDPARASQLYRSLEAGNDTWARNALYAHGRLAAARGNTEEARRLLEQYLKRFPSGSNAQDARAVLQRLR